METKVGWRRLHGTGDVLWVVLHTNKEWVICTNTINKSVKQASIIFLHINSKFNTFSHKNLSLGQ